MLNRLIVFTESYARGGGNRYMIDLANAVADDFDCVDFVSNPGGIYPDEIKRFKRYATVSALPVLTRHRFARHLSSSPYVLQKFLSFVCLLCEPLMLIANMTLFYGLFANSRPRLILACNGGYPASAACLAAVLAARLSNIPVVLSVVSMPSRRRPYFWLYDALLDTLVCRSSRFIVVNAQAISVALQNMRKVADGRVVVIRNGIEDSTTNFAELRTTPVVIGCVARLDTKKGVFVLLDAFSRLLRKRSDLRLILAGDGDASVEVKAWLNKSGLQDKITLLGHFTGDINKLIRSFDIFAFPSLWEGLPYGVIEAMRSQCAIVATRVGGIPELIVDGREGLLVEAGDVSALAAALYRMIDDSKFRNACASAARLRFLQEFSLQEMHRRARVVIMEAVV